MFDATCCAICARSSHRRSRPGGLRRCPPAGVGLVAAIALLVQRLLHVADGKRLLRAALERLHRAAILEHGEAAAAELVVRGICGHIALLKDGVVLSEDGVILLAHPLRLIQVLWLAHHPRTT